MKRIVRPIICLAALSIACGGVPASAITVTYKPVLVNGQPAPGLPGETLTVTGAGAIPSAPVIDSQGRFVALALRATALPQVVVAGDSRASPPTLRIVSLAGVQAPEMPQGVQIQFFPGPFLQIGAGGRAIFLARFIGTGITLANDEAWYVETAPGEIHLLVRDTQPVPGLPGVTVTNMNSFEQAPATSPSGVIAFSVLLSSGTALWRATMDNPGAAAPIAVQGQAVPGQTAGVAYSFLPQNVQVTDAGEVVAVVGMAGPGVVGDGSTLVAYPPGSTTPRILARRGGTVGGITLGGMNSVSPISHGSGFVAAFANVGTTSNSMFITGRADGTSAFRALSIPGTPLPQVGAGVTIAGGGASSRLISLSGLDRAVYVATLAGTGVNTDNDSALFTEGPSGAAAPTLVAREGFPAPGLSAGVVMGAFERFGGLPTDIAVNDRRQALVMSSLRGSGVSSSNDYAVWSVDPNGVVQLLMREGSPITLGAGDTRTITTIGARRRGASTPSMGWLNDTGEFIIDLTFSNGTRDLLVGRLEPPPQIAYRTAVVSGEAAPGAASGAVFQGFQASVPVINAREEVLIIPSLGGSVNISQAVALVRPSTGPRVIAAVGDQLPTLPAGATLSRAYLPSLDDDGDVETEWMLSAGGETILVAPASGAALSPIVTSGDPVPGIPGATFVSLVGATGAPDVNRAGAVLQAATITGGGSTTADNGVYIRVGAGGGGVEVLARRGGQAPGAAAGQLFSTLTPSFQVDDAGNAYMAINLSGTGVTSANNSGLWKAPPMGMGPLALFARESQQAPGLAPGVLLGAPLVPRCSPRGDVAFGNTLTGSGIVASNDGCLFVVPPGGGGATGLDNARLAARESMPAPGFPTGASIATIEVTVVPLNNRGRIAYTMTATGGGVSTLNDSGFITEAPGDTAPIPTLIAREGSHAPGCSVGVTFAELTTLPVVLAIDDAGHTAFLARVQGTGITTANDQGLWIVGPDGATRLVARKGDPIPVASAGLTANRTISTFHSLGDPFARSNRRWLVNGRVVFAAAFTDGTSAVMVATLPSLCRSDFNNDGTGSTLDDLFGFLAAWFAQLPSADINGIDGVTVQDLFDFLVLWFAGCS